jgi:hypothetical protein
MSPTAMICPDRDIQARRGEERATDYQMNAR